jgi:hypothetical protein
VNLFGHISTLMLLISLGLWALMLFALTDALVRPTVAYPLAGKRTKLFWTLVVGVTFAVSLLTGPVSLFGLVGIAAAVAYIVDVRPALRAVGRGGGSSRDSYGSW